MMDVAARSCVSNHQQLVRLIFVDYSDVCYNPRRPDKVEIAMKTQVSDLETKQKIPFRMFSAV